MKHKPTASAPIFLDTLYSDIDSLAYFAGIHRIVLGYHRLLSKRFPFAVYYRVSNDEVTVRHTELPTQPKLDKEKADRVMNHAMNIDLAPRAFAG